MPANFLLDEAVLGDSPAGAAFGQRCKRADPATTTHLPVEINREGCVARARVELSAVLRRELGHSAGGALRPAVLLEGQAEIHAMSATKM